MLTAKLSPKGAAAIKRYDKTLAKNMGRPLTERAQRTTNAAAKRVLIQPLQDAMPRSGRVQRRSTGPIKILGQKRRKTMARSPKAKLLRKRGGEDIRPTWIGVAHFAFGWLTHGTKGHALATRGLTGSATRGSGGQFGRFGRFTSKGNYRSGFAHFPPGAPQGEGVRPLAGIYVSGVRGKDYVGPVWDANKGDVYRLIERGVFQTK